MLTNKNSNAAFDTSSKHKRVTEQVIEHVSQSFKAAATHSLAFRACMASRFAHASESVAMLLAVFEAVYSVLAVADSSTDSDKLTS